MTEARDEMARNTLQQHIRQCELARAEDRRDRELAAAEVARKLAEQNRIVDEMHKVNIARFEAFDKKFDKLMWGMWGVVGALLLGIGGLTVELLKVWH